MTQAAVAWVLTTVFIRFCEDNALVKPVWISGPEGRRQEALDAQLAFFRAHPEDTDREWLMQAVDYLAALPATKALVDPHSALHLVAPSGDAVTALLDFWRRREDNGALVHDLTDKSLSTRFLGDLYQDLSQYAKDTYALLQTPVFVEEFILDQTLEPALKERPLEGFKLIDPTCGSGHFLLGAFDRLLERWHKHAPNVEIRARVQTALDAIHGVDLNPFAVAIARFRLTVAALSACGERSLEDAPAFTFHLAVGDSLIHGPDRDVLPGMADRSAYMSFTYATEDGPLLLTILEEGRYDVVVGNPPYITVKDKALNKVYRAKYRGRLQGHVRAHRALHGPVLRPGQARRPGRLGRPDHQQLLHEARVRLQAHRGLPRPPGSALVADTSGAYIPGHGTPTVIIVGRNDAPVAPTVRAVLGVRGEPGRPDDPAKGIVWTSICEHVDDPGWDDSWITVADLDRTLLPPTPGASVAAAPYCCETGSKTSAPGNSQRRSLKIGFGAVTREDDAFMTGEGLLRRHGISPEHSLANDHWGGCPGLAIRSWNHQHFGPIIEARSKPNAIDCATRACALAVIAPYVAAAYCLREDATAERGLTWFEYSMLSREALSQVTRQLRSRTSRRIIISCWIGAGRSSSSRRR